MKNKIFASVMLVLLSQNVYCESFKDKLRASLKKVLEEQQESAESNQQASGQERVDSAQNLADGALMTQGMWRDPKTDLIWLRCSLGQVWNGTQCDGEPAKYTWLDAVLYVKDLKLLGENDWRIPTKEEFSTVFRCEEGECVKNGEVKYPVFSTEIFMTPNVYNYLYYTSSISIDYYEEKKSWIFWKASEYSEEPIIYNYANMSTADLAIHRLILVRGGQPNDLFSDIVEIAKVEIKKARQYKEKLKEDAEKEEEKAKEQLKKEEEYRKEWLKQAKLKYDEDVAKGKENMIKIQQNKKVYAEKTIELRKRVKVGDYTKQGLVIAINGTLVRVQQYGRQCIRYSSSFNKYNNSYDCVDYQKIITGEAWVNRNELLP